MSIIIAAKKLIEHVDNEYQFQFIELAHERVQALVKALEIGEPDCPVGIKQAADNLVDVIKAMKAVDIGGVSVSWLRTTLIHNRKL